MKNRNDIHSFFLASMIALCLVCISGCRRQQENRMPMVRANLLREIFTALDAKNYDDALAKLERYETMDRDNQYLPQLKQQILINSVIVDIRSQMERGEFQKALDSLNKRIQEYGELPRLLELRAECRKLAELDRSLVRIKTARNAAEMRNAAMDLQEIVAQEPARSPLSMYANRKLAEANQMEKWESDCALLYLTTQQIYREYGVREGNTALAVLDMMSKNKKTYVSRLKNSQTHHKLLDQSSAEQ